VRALTVSRNGVATLAELPRPVVPGQCLIRVLAAGICGTDLHLLNGYADFSGVPGHEFVGVVEACGADDARSWIGKRVVGDINIGCGTCDTCARGVKEHCPNRRVLGIINWPGAFADYISLPAANLHVVPDSLPDEVAVFAEPTAAACRILEQASVGPSTRAVVLGDGRFGQLIAQTLNAAGAETLLAGKHPAKLQIARALGVRTAVADSMPASASNFDLVVEATGRSDGLQRALTLVRPRGVVVLKSTFSGEVSLSAWPIVVHEVTLIGSRCGPFGPALELLANGTVQPAPLISSIATLEDFERAFATARSALKVIFRM
jgi:alcohol dehydrogenase